MASDPDPFQFMTGKGGIEAAPQILVLDRMPRRSPPSVPLPAGDPLHDAITHVTAVGMESGAAGAVQRLQRGDRRPPFHAVARRQRLTDRKSTRLNSRPTCA